MSSIIGWLRSLGSKEGFDIHIKVHKRPNVEETKVEESENIVEEKTKEKEFDIMTLTEKYWLTILFVFLRYFSILMYGSGIGFIIAGILVSPWWYIGLASWPLFIMIGVVNMVYISALTKHHRLQFRYILNGAN